MSQLTEQERTVLQHVRDGRTCDPACSCRAWTRRLADKLRVEHPDVDDVTLARIVLTVANHLSVAVMYHRYDGGHLSHLTARTAVDLAALELDHPTR